MDIVQKLRFLIAPFIGDRLIPQVAGKPDDGVQRRAEFMAHIGQQHGFCPACLFGLVACHYKVPLHCRGTQREL